MVRSTFLFRWHIFLLHHALWSRIRQICRLRIYSCLKLVTIACFLEDVLTLCQKDPSVKKYEQVSFLLDVPKEEDIFGQNTDKSFSWLALGPRINTAPWNFPNLISVQRSIAQPTRAFLIGRTRWKSTLLYLDLALGNTHQPELWLMARRPELRSAAENRARQRWDWM